jgi:tetratricopeptide (TPR) repeat protein
MTIKFFPQPFSRPFGLRLSLLCAAVISMAISFATPVFADDLADAQRLVKQGQYPQALEKVDAYLGSQPKDAQGRFLKGIIYTEMNKPNEAIAIFSKLSEDYPELPEPYNNLAVLYAQQQQYDKARAALEKAIRTHPSYTIAYENLGDVYAKLASQAYDKALELGSGNAATQNKLALIHDLISVPGKGNVKPPASSSVLANTVASSGPPAKVAEAKPATALSATAKPASASEARADPAADGGVKQAITAWAKAWEAKDMKAYLGAYTADFRPPKNVSRKDWEAERTARIAGKSGKISIQIEALQTTIDGDTATAKFHQHYTAPGLRSSSTKTLILARSGNRWLIKEESTR